MAIRTKSERSREDIRANGGSGYSTDGRDWSEFNGPEQEPGCAVKQLPARLQLRAAEIANRINPVNSPVFGAVAEASGTVLPTPMAAAVVTGKYWGPAPRRLTVSFFDTPSAELRRLILSHLNAWSRTGCIEFVETGGVGQIRISRGPGGYWSYLGTDVLLIPPNHPTMNLQGFTVNTPVSEYTRVVRHEAGHTLGMPHEHMRGEIVARIDRQKAYDYFWRTQGWPPAVVDQQVLTPLDNATILGTPPDQDSIMCYFLPGSITVDGQPIRGGADINQSDYDFIGLIYPRATPRTAATGVTDVPYVGDWAPEEDVQEVAVEAY